MSLSLEVWGDAIDANKRGAIVPPWLADFSKNDLICKWTEDAWNQRCDDMSYLWSTGRDNLMRYLGYYPALGSGSIIGGASYNGRMVKPPLNARIGINLTRLMIEQRVSKTNKITPVTQVVAAQDDERDKSGARTAQKILDSFKYRNDFKALRTKKLRRGFVWGEGYTFTRWNKRLGGTTGKTEKVRFSHDDRTIKLERSVCRGDVEVSLLRNDDVVFLLGVDAGGVFPYGCIIAQHRPTIEVKADYPEKADEIEPSKINRFSYSSFEDEEVADHTTELHVYIRSNIYAPQGMHWICTDKTVLVEPTDNPMPMTAAMECSEMGNLPIERITDVDIEGFFHGTSALMDINSLQNQYDKLTSFIMRSIWLFAHPKLVVPRGGVNIEQLSAGGGLVVQSSGPFQPFVATYPVISQDVLMMWERIPELMGKLYGVFDHSLGQAPTGTRSASQLMIYDEQEEETRETIKQKLEAAAIGTDAKILALYSEHLKGQKTRVIEVLGENRMWHPEEVSIEDLRKDTVVRLKVSSLLPENKYARVRTLVELHNMTAQSPEGPLFSNGQLMDALEMGQHEKFIDYAKVAVQSAESENERFLKGEEVEEPEMFEDLTTHWKIHAKMLQTTAFKKRGAKEREAAVDHMRATEYLMFRQADQNPAYQQELLSLRAFPLVFVQQDLGIAAPPAPMGPDASRQMGNQPGPELAAITGQQQQQ